MKKACLLLFILAFSSHAKADGIVEYIQKIIDDNNLRISISNELLKIKAILGEPGASDRAARKILSV